MDDTQEFVNLEALDDAIESLNNQSSDAKEIDLYKEVGASDAPPQMVHENEEQLEQKKKAKSNRFQKRISQMTHEINYEKQARMRAEARAREAELKAEENSRIAHLNYQYLLAAKKSQIKERLKIAEEEGDTDAKTELIDQLSNVNAELKDFENSKSYSRESYYPQEYERYDTYDRYQESDADSEEKMELEDFLSDHEWMDDRSENFDPDMYEQAQVAASEIARYLRANGAADKIKSVEFYRQVAKVVEDQYRLSAQPAPSSSSGGSSSYYRPSSPPTTPISRSSYPGSVSYDYRQDSNYIPQPTREDVEQAQKLIGILRKPSGEPYTEKELILLRAKQREKNQRSGASYGR